MVLCCCAAPLRAFPSINAVVLFMHGLQPRRWWLSRRRCMIPATLSGTGTSSSATTRATGTWSPAMRDRFKSCMFSSSFAYIYMGIGEFIIFLFCHDFHGSTRCCSQVYDEQEPLRHTVAGDRKNQVAALSVSQKIQNFRCC